MPTREEITKMWLDWVINNSPEAEDKRDIQTYCYFCGKSEWSEDMLMGHEEDCIFRITEEHIKITGYYFI